MRAGVETLDRITVDAIIENSKGEILLIEENSPKEYHFAGGGIEIGETALQALEKEIREETGYTDFEVIGEVSGSFVAVDGFRHTKQKNQRSIGRFYHVKLLSEARLHSEVEDGHHSMVWVPVSEVATKITWDSHRSAWNILKN